MAAAMSPLCILLAEDSPANQKLVAYILDECGHTIDVTADGRQAVCLAQRKHYDVILMDVQMPGMDGWEATKAIRAWENARTRVPIIAMTAHATEADRQRCLAAGMDAYLTKPIDGHELIALLERLAVGGAASPPTGVPAASPAVAEVFDLDLAVRRCFNNPKMLRDMIGYFFAEMDSLFPLLRAAWQRGDWDEVGNLGHRLKGTVVYLGAEAARAAAAGVERFSDSEGGTPAEADDAINALDHECLRLKAALTAHPL